MKKWMICVAMIQACIISCKGDEEQDKNNRVDHEKVALVNDLKKRVAQNPDSAGVRMRLVNALDSLGLYREAIAQTDSMISRDSLNNGLWFAKAQLQESSKDTFAAIESYKKAVAIYPSVDAQLSLANLFAETKNKGALVICQNIARLGLGREVLASCDFIAGVYYARTGKKDQALQLFDRTIKNNYTLMEAYMEKGFIYYEAKNYAEALKVFGTAITVNNMYSDAYYWQAKCYEAMGNKEEAIVNYQRSLGLDKSLKEAREAIKRLS